MIKYIAMFLCLSCVGNIGDPSTVIDAGDTYRNRVDAKKDTSNIADIPKPAPDPSLEALIKDINCVGPELGRLIGASLPVPVFEVKKANCGADGRVDGYSPDGIDCYNGLYYHDNGIRTILVVEQKIEEFRLTLVHEVAHWRVVSAGHDDEPADHGFLFHIALKHAESLIDTAVSICYPTEKDAGID